MRTLARLAPSTCLLALVVSPLFGQRMSPSIVVEMTESPAGSGSAQPQLTVSADGVLLSWIERAGPRASLKFSERKSGAWLPARTAASGTDWFVNWADVPSVIRLDGGTLAAHWLQKNGGDAEAYDVQLSYSRDEGRTWAPSFSPHHDGTKSQHGFASLLTQPGGGLGVVWLDGRAMSGGHEGHGSMAVRFGAFDKAWTQIDEATIDGKVCECCPTAAAMTADGALVAFRNRSDGDVRDIYVSRRQADGWTEPVAVSNDGWTLTACPVNGPAISAHNRDVIVAWFTASNSQPRVMAAFSRNAGRTFGAPIRIDEKGSLGRVDVDWLDNGKAVVSWIEYASGAANFRLRTIDPGGAVSEPVTVAPMRIDRSNGYPRLARLRNEIVLAWTESVPAPPPATGNVLRVRTAIAKTQ